MSGWVFVIQEPSLDWVVMCTDTRCAVFPHPLAETLVKFRAEAAATRRRRLLKTMSTVDDVRYRPETCSNCEQSTNLAATIAELRNLIAVVEARLPITRRRWSRDLPVAYGMVPPLAPPSSSRRPYHPTGPPSSHRTSWARTDRNGERR